MRLKSIACLCTIVVFLSFTACVRTAQRGPDYPVAPVSYKDVQVSDSFWTPRMEINRTVSIPGLFDRYEQKGQNPDLRLIEAACYVLARDPDPALRSRVDATLDRAIEQIRSRKQVWSSEGDGDFFWAGHFLELAGA